jgi:hypothetical protein
MTYIPQESKVLYQSKDGRQQRLFDSLEWLAAMSTHVPNKGESRLSGSQVLWILSRLGGISRGKRQKETHDRLVPCILQPEQYSKAYRRNWACSKITRVA